MAAHIYCHFCGRLKGEVLVLIAGPTVFICDRCVDLCCVIVAQHRRPLLEVELEGSG